MSVTPHPLHPLQRRNDAISTVRAAALVSLEGIGGPEAESAMHLTKVLTEEIASLQHISERRRE